MLRFLRDKVRLDTVALIVIGLVLFCCAWAFDVHEVIDDYAHHHHVEGLEAVFPGVVIVGLLGFFHGMIRIRDLHREVRKRRLAENHVKWIARHDPLTHLPNRRFLEEKIARHVGNASVQAPPLTAISLDLDGFKKANDLIGHHGGDEILMEVANRLRGLVAEDRIHRLGGDEFLILLPRSEQFDIDAFGRRLIDVLSTPILFGAIATEIGASVGYACYPEDSTSLAEVIRLSDIAMYAAKKMGRNNVRSYNHAMNDDVALRSKAQSALRQAISDGLIHPYYQPLIDLKSGVICGFEALARWQADDGTFIPPAVFIELAESSGMITALSEQILRAACRDAVTWPDHIRLSVNLSPVQLNDPMLGMRIIGTLLETGLRPGRLEIEITESALIQNISLAESTLGDLHRAGVSISLDDFGTGYSSLSQLSTFRFDKIKIDRSFISNFDDDERQEQIVRAMLSLGQGLGVATTAEGIEDETQLMTLRTMGCDFGQGFLFSKAVPAEQALSLVSSQGEPRVATRS